MTRGCGVLGAARGAGLVAALLLGGAAVPAAPLTHPFRVDGLDGSNGVRLNALGVITEAVRTQEVGRTLAGIGDINGDGFEDFAVSMNGVSSVVAVPLSSKTLLRGRVYVVLGRERRWQQGVVSLGDLGPDEGFYMEGPTKVSRLGISLAGAGDVNGDGYADFLLGAWDSFPPEAAADMAVYLVFGRPEFPGTLDLDPSTAQGVVRFYSDQEGDGRSIGRACAGIGDVNGDGFADLYLAGAKFWDSTVGTIVYGRAGGWPVETFLDGLAPGSERTPVVGALDDSQPAISGLGDVNGDGVDDFALAFPIANSTGGSQAGTVYVVHGRPGGYGEQLDVSTLDGTNGFRLDGDVASTYLGIVLTAVGDVSSDGVSDFFAFGAKYPVGQISGAQTSLILGASIAGAAPVLPVSQRSSCRFVAEESAVTAGASGGSFGTSSTGQQQFLLGAPGASFGDPPPSRTHGATYLLRYDPTASPCPVGLSGFDATAGVRLDGAIYPGEEGGRFGERTATGFDFDGDGLPDAAIASTFAHSLEGEINLVYGFDGPSSLTLRRHVAPGDAPRAGVGMLGNGSHTIPHARLWIDFGSGDDGAGGASLVTVTVRRSLDGLSNLPGPAAAVQWIGEWDRPGWDGANITLKYLDAEVAGLDPARLRLYSSSSPDGPWTEAQFPLVDTRRKRVGGVVWTQGYYVLVEKPQAGGDVNKDGGVTPADAQQAFECSLGNCPPEADTAEADVCPPGGDGAVTPWDAAAILRLWLGLAPCE